MSNLSSSVVLTLSPLIDPLWPLYFNVVWVFRNDFYFGQQNDLEMSGKRSEDLTCTVKERWREGEGSGEGVVW